MRAKRKIRWSLKQQLTMILVTFSVTVLLSDVFIFFSYGNTLVENSVETNKITLEMISTDISTQFDNISLVAESLRKETSVISYVSPGYSTLDEAAQQSIRNAVTKKLFNAIMLQTSSVTNCCLIRNHEDYLIQNPYSYGLINDSFIQRALEEIGDRQSARIVPVQVDGSVFYCYYFPVYPGAGGEHGRLLFVLNNRMFGTVFGKYKSAGKEFFCLDVNSEIAYHSTYYLPELPAVDLTSFPANSVSVARDDGWVHLRTRILNTPFCVYLRVSYNEILEEMYTTLKVEALLVVGTILLLTGLFIYSIKRLYARIREINYMLGQVSGGNLDFRYSSEKSDEISDIGYNINMMVDRINSLVIETAQKELAVKKAQFRSVQMQINPHFLFNTLETIRMVGLYHNDMQVVRMVKDLSDLFRYTIASTNPIVSIDDELNHTLKYLELQKNRNKNQFSVKIDVDPIALDYALLRLILQPLVENAITHGIEPKYTHCELKISIHLVSRMIHLSVEDSGIGIPDEKLEYLTGVLTGELPPPANDEHIGLYNVSERIRLYFGKETKMTIDSKYGEGARVHLCFPAVRYNKTMKAEDLCVTNPSELEGSHDEKDNAC